MPNDDDDYHTPVTVRLPDAILEELEELRPLLKQLPEYAAQTSLSRSALIRIAITHGIHRLRAELQDRDARDDQVDILEKTNTSSDD